MRRVAWCLAGALVLGAVLCVGYLWVSVLMWARLGLG